MKTRRRSLIVVMLAVLAMSIAALLLSFQPKTTVYASRNNSGTTTDETEWTDKTNHTTGNLITIQAGALTEQGWQGITNDIKSDAVWHTDAKLDTEAYGYGIQAKTLTDNIGNNKYEGGVWYRITLSEADKVKAKDDTLTVSASALYYRTSGTTHYVSLKLFFDDASNTQLDQKEIAQTITQSAYPLTITDYKVPKDTASIRYYVSNYNGGTLARPFIGGLSCTLKDGKDPGISTLAIDKSGVVDEKNNVAIAGNTVKYSINFSEKISVNSYGTAKLCLKGTTITTSSSSESVITKNGKSTVYYSFTLPELGKSGKLSFSVEELNVEDESGRAYTYTNTSVNLTSLQYYAPMSVSSKLTNLTFKGVSTANYSRDYSATLTAATGYDLPTSVSVEVGGSVIKSGYTYSNGTIKIDGKSIKGDIVITADGVAKKSTVTLDQQGGSGGTTSVTATYKSEMPAIEKLPTRKGYTFLGYFSSAGNTGKQYYNANGESMTTCDFYVANTLYAHWQVNTYTIEYMPNKPSNASHNVTGSTASSTHTYDQSKALTKNGFKLHGWTFKGWKFAGNSYKDGEEVVNLAEKGTIQLYAVWEQNFYRIQYDKNTPENAKNQNNEVTGEMTSNAFQYDYGYPLDENKYQLTGWKFLGWAYSKTATTADLLDLDIADNLSDKLNLADQPDARITLYAVWEANTYTIEYNSNIPETASGNISGTMQSVTHTYDTPQNLTTNGYTLQGWHFCGWAETQNGAVKYKDGASVKNLTAVNGDSVNLYAVWEANTYTIVYNSNIPETASGDISGTMQSVTHTYDTEKNLDDNQFTLTGWTFRGWAETQNGAVRFQNGQKVSNLTAENDGTVILYAVWQANTYTISFNTDGGNFVQETSATFDSALPSVGVPARKGYQFCGYFSEESGNGVQFYDKFGKATENMQTYTEDQNIELYACWSVIYYNIDLYSGGRYVTTLENVAFDYMRLPTATALTLSREHYNFVGWNLYDNQDWKMFSADYVYTVGIGYVQNETVTLYAAWKEKNVYSVNYDANGGGGAPGVEQKHEDETFKLKDTIPTRENYTFLGWSLTPDANSAYYPAGIENELTMGSSPITLYAVWKRNPSLSFDANGGAFSSAPEIRYPAAGSEVSIPSATPERTGHIFAGWSTEKGASIADYPADGSQKITMPDADTVLYAVWQKQKYTITSKIASDDFEIVGLLGEYEYEATATFTIKIAAGATGEPLVYVNGELLAAKNGEYSFTVRGESYVLVAVADGSALTLVYSANGGTGAPYDNNVYKSGDTAAILSATPTRYGYTFLGWAEDPETTEAKYKKGETNTYTFGSESAVLYAVWQANTYTVSYDANGGTGDMSSGKFTFGTKGTLAKNAFERSGHTFIGWSLSQNGTAAYKDCAEIADLCADENGIVILYAVWEQTVTKISFNAEGGKENNGALSVAYGEELTGEKLAFPTRSGYKFAGYFTQQGGEGEKIFDAALNAVYSGKWDKNLTALTLYADWQPISYTIVYMVYSDDVNELKEAGSQTEIYDRKFNLLTAAELAITPKEYHHFVGWTTAPSGQVVMYADGQEISSPLSDADGEEVIFYAVFAENDKYSVIYNANGGSNAPIDSNTYYAGETVIILSEEKLVKDGYEFQGWRFNPNSSDDILQPGTKITMQEGGITLYAVWQADETLTEKINAVKVANAELKAAHDSLQEAFDNLNGTVTGKDGLSDKIAALLTRMNAAESTLNSLGETYATIAALRTEIANLKSTLEAADETLSERISAVESSLSGALKSIQNLTSGKANQSDFANLKEAFETAKTLLDSEIVARGEKDTELEAKIAALQSSYDNLSQKLTNEIQKVTNTINAKVKELSDGKADKTALEELDTTLTEADRLLKLDIEKLKNEDTALKGELATLKDELEKLKTSYAAADSALQDAIDDVQRQLDEAVQKISDLNSGKANQSDFASLKEAFESAETLLNSEIITRKNKDESLEKKDAELEAKITNLTNALNTAQSALETKINEVKRQLDEAVEALNASIAGNATDIKEKLAAAKRAYEAADIVINGEITSLKDTDTELSGRISALELSCQAADEALWAGIRQVQENLEALRAGMESKNGELENGIDSVDADNDKLIFLNVLFYVVLGVVVLTSVLATKVRKPIGKRKK